MHRFLRSAHLAFGLFSSAYLFMYGWSAMQMSHNSWFDLKPAIEERTIPLGTQFAGNPRATARELMDRYGMTGQIMQSSVTDEGARLRINRPGAIHDVTYVNETGEARVRTSVATFPGVLNQVHHVHGLWHEWWPYQFAGALVGAISVILIPLSLTGIYLWFKIHKERKVGAVLLGAQLVYGIAVILAIRGA